jgi:hypothetical protein
MPVVINEFEAVAEPQQSTAAEPERGGEEKPRDPPPPESVALALAALHARTQRLWAH